MLKVLHIYPHDNDMMARYINMLQRVMGKYEGTEPDLVHCHGCWNHDAVKAARRYGVRMVLSPHGQLQPWMMEQQALAKAQTWQRHFAASCYALIAQGRLEAACLQKLGWNPRIETVRNPLFTATISESEACRQLGAIYQKVMDSNVRQLMTGDTLTLLASLLKAGITGDRRWVWNHEALPASPDESAMRQIRIYAYQENIAPLVERGIEVLRLDVPPLDASAIASYLPTNYQRPQPLTELLAIVAAMRQHPSIRLACDLHTALRQTDVNDAQLADTLKQKRMLKLGRRLMAVLAHLTQLDEGFMPLPPLDDKQTIQIEATIAENLSII